MEIIINMQLKVMSHNLSHKIFPRCWISTLLSNSISTCNLKLPLRTPQVFPQSTKTKSFSQPEVVGSQSTYLISQTISMLTSMICKMSIFRKWIRSLSKQPYHNRIQSAGTLCFLSLHLSISQDLDQILAIPTRPSRVWTLNFQQLHTILIILTLVTTVQWPIVTAATNISGTITLNYWQKNTTSKDLPQRSTKWTSLYKEERIVATMILPT